ncbi:acetoin reductase family protein [Meredithblackwellia eburnea MCA 4105]
MTRPIAGKVALVTGAGQGIGRAIALRLAEDGYDVAVNDIPFNKKALDQVVLEIKALQRKSIGVLADVSKEDEVDIMVAKVVEELGSLDCMVSNAGICPVAPLVETTQAQRAKIVDVNLHGLMNTHIAAARQMIKQGKGGRIIGACSIAGYAGSALSVTYATTKWAVRGFTQNAAKEWAKFGIRVTAYAPGIVDTEMGDFIAEKMDSYLELPAGSSKKARNDQILLGRSSVPADVGKVVSFLASEDSEYMTGQTIITDGGIRFT